MIRMIMETGTEEIIPTTIIRMEMITMVEIMVAITETTMVNKGSTAIVVSTKKK